MEPTNIREIKVKDSYFYYLDGRLIKSNKPHLSLPNELFRSKGESTQTDYSVYIEGSNYYSKKQIDSEDKYIGFYQTKIGSLLESNDYVSLDQTKEEFVGYKILNEANLRKVFDASFLASITVEQKIERLDSLLKKYHLSMLKEDTRFNSIPVPCLLSDDLIIADSTKEARLQFYFKSLENQLNQLHPTKRWIVTDSFDTLNHKFVNYFSTELILNNQKEKLFTDDFDPRYPKPFEDAEIIYSKLAFGYSGFIRIGESKRISSIQFATSIQMLKTRLLSELFSRYIQNENVYPTNNHYLTAQSLEIFTMENLNEFGIFLFCISTEDEKK